VELVTLQLPTNTNYVEAWHNRLRILASRSHVSIAELFRLIQDEAVSTMKTEAKYKAGKLTRQINLECKKSRERIIKIMKKKDGKSNMRIISAIAENIRFDQ
jgi:hypothetical protein